MTTAPSSGRCGFPGCIAPESRTSLVHRRHGEGAKDRPLQFHEPPEPFCHAFVAASEEAGKLGMPCGHFHGGEFCNDFSPCGCDDPRCQRPTAPREQEAEAKKYMQGEKCICGHVYAHHKPDANSYGQVMGLIAAACSFKPPCGCPAFIKEPEKPPTPSAPTALKALDAKHPPLWEGYEYRPVVRRWDTYVCKPHGYLRCNWSPHDDDEIEYLTVVPLAALEEENRHLSEPAYDKALEERDALAAKLAGSEDRVKILAEHLSDRETRRTRAEADLERSRERTYAAEAALKEAVALLKGYHYPTECWACQDNDPCATVDFLARVSRAAGMEKP